MKIYCKGGAVCAAAHSKQAQNRAGLAVHQPYTNYWTGTNAAFGLLGSPSR